MFSTKLIKKVLGIFLMSTLAFLAISSVEAGLNALNKPVATIETIDQNWRDLSPLWIGAPIASMPVINGVEKYVKFEVDSKNRLHIGFPDADDVVINPTDKAMKVTYRGYEKYTIYIHWDNDENVKTWFLFEHVTKP